MKSTEAARALAARRKTHGPEPVRRWYCGHCDTLMGTNEMRRHTSCDDTLTNMGRINPLVYCDWCGELMTRSQTRTHRCEEGK